MMTHLIRVAHSEDYDGVSKLVAQIQQLHVEARPDIYAPCDNPMGIDYFRKILREERTFVIVAESLENGTIDAYTVIRIDEAAFRPIYTQRKFMYIDDFCVEESQRGKGIGTKLFHFLIEYAKEIQANYIELGVAEFNISALQFYESIGMKTRSRKMELFIE
jgi:ribosomal protein S18 acetylase RimI-like enzyme